MAEFVTAFLLLVFSTAQCPPKWDLRTGIRRDGSYTCFSPLPDCCGDAAGPCELVKCPPGDTVSGRIHCTNGQEPIVVDYRTVACQQRH